MAAWAQRGGADMKRSFDVGAGPSLGIDVEVRALRDLADDGDVDAELVDRVSFMEDWERLVYGDAPDGWTREEGDDVITVVCDPAELGRILAAMKALRPRVSNTRAWDALAAFLEGCAKRGSICLWYDPLG